jgi:Putative adhesin
VCGGAVLVGLLAGCGSDPSGAPVKHKGFAFGGKHLTVDANGSDLRLMPADVTDVEVTQQVDGWVFFGHGPRATWSMDGSTLRLDVKCTGVVSDCSGRHVVKVPRGVSVTVRDHDGKVTASGFDAGLSATSGNGGITARDISGGPLNLSTSNGSITTSGIASGKVTVYSDNGGISLNMVTVPDSVSAQSSNGSIKIGLPRASYAVDAVTHNGDTTVAVPKDAHSGHTVKARADNGGITVRTSQ